MKKYDTWVTTCGEKVPVTEMHDDHLRNTIRAIQQGRRLPKPDISLDRRGTQAGNESINIWATDRKAWLTVLRGEGLRRGLDVDGPRTKKVGLIDWLFKKTGNNYLASMVQSFYRALDDGGIVQPQIELNLDTNLPTYQHWSDEHGLGKPLGEAVKAATKA